MQYSSLSAEELAKACAESGNDEAWQEFVRRFHKPISVVVLRVAHLYGDYSGSQVDDLIQETYLKICVSNRRLLRDFLPLHPNAFYGMLKVTAANAAHDYYRREGADRRRPNTPMLELSEVEPFVSDGRSPGAARIELDILIKEIDDILVANRSSTAARDREIFWLYYGPQGLTAKEIAGIKHYHLDVSGVESVLQRLKCLVCRALAEKPEPPEQPLPPTGEPDHLEGNSPPNPLDQEEGQT